MAEKKGNFKNTPGRNSIEENLIIEEIVTYSFQQLTQDINLHIKHVSFEQDKKITVARYVVVWQSKIPLIIFSRI